MKFLEAKLVTLGRYGVGKSAIVKRYVDKSFEPAYRQTIGACFLWCKLNVEDINLTLHIWDTAGEERFQSIMPMYYRAANAALLVFDLSSYESFVTLKQMLIKFERNSDEHVVRLLIGNKLDLKDKRDVSEKEAREFASKIDASYHEVSALADIGIDEIFHKASSELVNLINQKKETTMKFYECNKLIDNSRKQVLKLLNDSNGSRKTKKKKCSCK
ncbi:ras-related protein Rab-22A-like [Leptopilina heterotoma]|uniref:ras-related protein Rab-22A-like n=1 Tax=Leptopilina heterotoma TaxID=63436 RepID=UPI001CA7DF03|nr:ras-related protein Rab-22A-like [Leptopilina heterotoma]